MEKRIGPRTEFTFVILSPMIKSVIAWIVDRNLLFVDMSTKMSGGCIYGVSVVYCDKIEKVLCMYLLKYYLLVFLAVVGFGLVAGPGTKSGSPASLSVE